MSDSNTGDIRQNKKVQADRMEFKVLRQNRGSNYLNGISFPQYGCLFFKKLFPLLSLACFQFWSVYLLPFHLLEKQSNSIKTILISRLPFQFNILKKVLSFKASRYIYFTHSNMARPPSDILMQVIFTHTCGPTMWSYLYSPIKRLWLSALHYFIPIRNFAAVNIHLAPATWITLQLIAVVTLLFYFF